MGVSKNGGTQQPWVFLLKMIILGCFGGTIIKGNTHIFPLFNYYAILFCFGAGRGSHREPYKDMEETSRLEASGTTPNARNVSSYFVWEVIRIPLRFHDGASYGRLRDDFITCLFKSVPKKKHFEFDTFTGLRCLVEMSTSMSNF